MGTCHEQFFFFRRPFGKSFVRFTCRGIAWLLCYYHRKNFAWPQIDESNCIPRSHMQKINDNAEKYWKQNRVPDLPSSSRQEYAMNHAHCSSQVLLLLCFSSVSSRRLRQFTKLRKVILFCLRWCPQMMITSYQMWNIHITHSIHLFFQSYLIMRL